MTRADRRGTMPTAQRADRQLLGDGGGSGITRVLEDHGHAPQELLAAHFRAGRRVPSEVSINGAVQGWKETREGERERRFSGTVS